MGEPKIRPQVTDDDLRDVEEWVECWNCCGDGWIEDDDPFWHTDEKCDVCDGQGGWNRDDDL